MFGQSTNNWNASTGFANQQPKTGTFPNSLGPTSTGLFGGNQQSSTTTGGLFGAKPNPPTSGGLFGNSQQNNTNTSSSLFGNSQQTSNTASGSLFGNTQQASNTSSGGLFGKPQTSNTGGLFGNPQPASTNASGSLFGNSQSGTTSGGLFGNSQNSTGLFSNPTSATTSLGANSTSGGLFGSKPASSNLFGNSSNSGTGLFANSNANSLNGPKTGGLFGSSATNSAQQQQTQLTNPYNADQLFSNLQREEDSLPRSITENLFAQNTAKTTSDKKRQFSHIEKPEPQKSSLLTRLGQTLKIFRNSTVNSSYNPIKGLFAQSNYLNGVSKNPVLPKSIEIQSKAVYQPSKRSIIRNARSGSMKRLIIKSKPLKFHLIDADKVFNSKRRRIVTNVILSDKLLSEKYSSDEDDDEVEAELMAKAKLSYKIETNGSSEKNSKVMEGESLKVEDLDEEIREEFDHGYWCSPPMKQLLQLPEENLASVENFIVGRNNYGQIAYDFPVDLRDIVRQAISHGVSVDKQLFGKNKVINLPKHGQVEVYLNCPTPRPALGTELNVPATITLEGIKPPSGSTTQEFIRKLRNQTGQEFLTYDPFKFVWVFRVKHFSVWGLVDDDKELAEVKRKQDEEEELTLLEYTRIYEHKKYEQELKKQKLSQHTNVLPGGWSYDTNNENLHLVAKRGLVANEITSRINAYKPDGTIAVEIDEDDIEVDLESDSDTSDLLMTDIIPATTDNRNFDYLKQMVSVLPRDTDYKEIIDEKAYEPELDNTAQLDNIQFKPDLAVSADWLVQLELANDINSPLVPLVSQSKGKIDIQKVDEILFSDFNKELLAANQVSTPTKKESPLETETEDIFSKNIASIIFDMLSKSTINTRVNKFPILEKLEGFSFADLLTGIQREEESELIQLGQSLFDDEKVAEECIDINGNDNELLDHVREIARKKIFGEWLRAYNIKTVKPFLNESKDDRFEYSFLQLCAGDLTGAIETMIEEHNNHLSVILTLVDSNEDTVIALAHNQLEDWKNNGVLHSIPAGCVKIYKLLAHEFDDILKDLPWNIELGVKLFYGDNSIKLCDMIQQMNFQQSNGVIELLKTYADIKQGDKKELSELSNSSLNSKLKWIIYLLLSNKYYNLSLKDDKLTLAFGDYLAKSGMWKEAIYVYTSLQDDSQTEKVERDLIFKNIDLISHSEEEYLVKVLKFPQSLIYEAIAYKYEMNKDYWQQCEALIRAKLWDRAHDSIIEQLGPQTVISNDVKLQQRLVSLMNEFPESGAVVPDWNKGAGIYKNYIEVLTEVNTNKLTWLLASLPFAKEKSTFIASSAVKLMSRKVGDLAIENITGLTASQVLNLPLTESDHKYFTIRLNH